jgi:hypothetical protein
MFPGFLWGLGLFSVALVVEHFEERAEANHKKLTGGGHH